MPTRVLRDWTDSEAVNSLSAEAERFFVRLIMKADDYGRFSGSAKILRPLMYPLLLDQVREASVQRWIAECVKSRLVRLYDVEGKQYIEIQNFRQRTRAEASKYPVPPGGPNDGHVSDKRQARVGHPSAYTDTETETKAHTETETAAAGHFSNGKSGNSADRTRAHLKKRKGLA